MLWCMQRQLFVQLMEEPLLVTVTITGFLKRNTAGLQVCSQDCALLPHWSAG